MTTPATNAAPAPAQSAPTQGAAPAAAATSAAAPAAAPAAASGAAPDTTQREPGSQGAPSSAQQQPSFARLVTRNRELETELARTKKEQEARKADLDLIAKIKDPKQRYAALEEIGGSYEEYTQLKLAGLRDAKEGDGDAIKLPPEVEARLKKLDDIEKRFNDEDKSKQTQQQQQQRENSRQYVRENLFKAGGEKYELSAALDSSDSVIELFNMRREQQGYDPDEHAVAAEIEQLNEKSITTQVSALVKTRKGRALLQRLLTENQPAPTRQQGVHGRDDEDEEDSASGLTNDLSAEPGTEPDYSKLDKAGLRARAREAMKKAGRRAPAS
jgi:hypothetical protein